MKTNTSIATTSNGTKLIRFSGSNHSSACTMLIKANGHVMATYEQPKLGMLNEAQLFAQKINSAISQKWYNRQSLKIERANYGTAKEALVAVTGAKFNGSILENCEIVK